VPDFGVLDAKPGEKGRIHMHEAIIQRAVKEAVSRADIVKHLGCHPFRNYLGRMMCAPISIVGIRKGARYASLYIDLAPKKPPFRIIGRFLGVIFPMVLPWFFTTHLIRPTALS
jgi:hypothetical protein